MARRGRQADVEGRFAELDPALRRALSSFTASGNADIIAGTDPAVGMEMIDMISRDRAAATTRSPAKRKPCRRRDRKGWLSLRLQRGDIAAHRLGDARLQPFLHQVTWPAPNRLPLVWLPPRSDWRR